MPRTPFDELRESKQQVEDQLPCRICGVLTKRETLSVFGARCRRCYDEYCATAMPPKVDVGDKRKGPRDWAYALQRRHQAGDRLTPAQLLAMREALRQPRHDTEDADQ